MRFFAIASLVLTASSWTRGFARDPHPVAPPPVVVAPAPVMLAVPVVRAPVAPVEPVVEELAVAGDLPAFVVRGDAPIVFLTGSCSHPKPSLEAFRRAVASHGGAVAIQGDLPCKGPDPTLRRFSPDTSRLASRIEAALAAAGADVTRERTLIGYSQGAERAEWLANRFPDRFTRFVLMAGPVVPSPAHMGHALAVATLAGHGDVRENMALGARDLRRGHVPATYLEIPGTKHGELSEAVDPFVAQALDWTLSVPIEDAELLGKRPIVVDRRAQRGLRETDAAPHRVERHARGARHLGE